MSQIKLKSSDEKCFAVDIKTAMRWKTIKNMLDNLGTDGLEDEIIPLPNLTAHTLEKILEWAEHHKDEPDVEQEEAISESSSTDLSDWDRAFLEVEKAEDRLLPLILAANYLDINLLMDTCCKYAASLIKGKTIDEIRQAFKIKTPEGQAKSTQDSEASPMEAEVEKKETSNENKLDLSTQ